LRRAWRCGHDLGAAGAFGDDGTPLSGLWNEKTWTLRAA
jgi:hypothetical protein